MGCASSNPLIDSGKKLINNVKESTSDFATKGENVIEETAETAKEKVVSGVGNIKGAVGEVLEDTENSIESVVGKFGSTFNTLKNDTNDEISELKHTGKQIKNYFVDNGTEALSETDTVLISETEHFQDEVHNIDDNVASEKINTEIENEKAELKDALVLEDLEQTWEADENKTDQLEDKLENVIGKTSPSPEIEDMKEELPTYWEVRADAILEDRMKSFDKNSIDDVSYEETNFEFPEQDQVNNKKEEVAEDNSTKNYNYSEHQVELDDYQFNNIVIITEH